MAELVHLHLESMLPELEQMERVKLFTTEEVKKIIKKRKLLEYLLRRRKKKKEDYLKYIQYEINVLSLITKRRQRLRISAKRKEIDHSIATRINKLFKAATTRYQSDEKLWLTQIEFCQRMKWHHTISALFARMLQAHTNKPELWVMAAKWEFEENNSPDNARHLLQRSLHFHSESKLLWTEYFRMELMYTDLILKRREVLGLQEVECSENDAVLKGKIASIVYEKATEAIPDAEFALSLIDICKQFEFTSTQIDQIFQDVQRRHPSEEVTLDAVAKRPLITLHEDLKNAKKMGIKERTVISELEKKICVSYEEAIKLASSEKMWSFYIHFVMERWKAAKKEKKKAKLLNYVLSLMERAGSADLLSSDRYIEWCKLLQSKGDEDLSCTVALQAARKWPKNVSLWIHCLTTHITAMKEDSLISHILNEGMESLSSKRSLPIWKLGIQWLSWSDTSALKDYFEKGITRHTKIKEIYLEDTAMRSGILAARELYKRLKCLYPVSPELFKKMILIENAQFKPSLKRLKRYYEDAIREYGSSSVDFWLDYMQFEQDKPNGEPILIHWKAIKTLDGHLVEDFVSRWNLLRTNNE